MCLSDHALSHYKRGAQAPEIVTLSHCLPLQSRSIFISSFASNMDEHKLGYKGNDVLQDLEILTMNAKAAQELILRKSLEKNQPSKNITTACCSSQKHQILFLDRTTDVHIYLTSPLG